jgi:predicted deacylase
LPESIAQKNSPNDTSGTLEFSFLKCIELSDGTDIKLPVITVNGTKPGKTLFLISTLHGQEITGIEIIRRICREEIKPSKLKGRIIAIPIANPLAFNTSSYHTIRYDYKDLNRSFPGDMRGSTTLRIADVIWKVVSKCDMLIDLHCITRALGNGYSIVRPVGNDDINKTCFEMANVFGLTVTVSKPRNVDEVNANPGLQEYAVSKGIPSLLLELNDWRRISGPTVEAGVTGIRNVLVNFGMIRGNLKRQRGKIIRSHLSQKMIMTNSGGIMHPRAELGERLKKGEIVAEILDSFGNIKETIRAPSDCYLLAFPQTENQAIATGEYVALLGYDDVTIE